MVERVVKRDGEVVPFVKERIERAITLAAQQSERPMDTDTIKKIASQIENLDIKQLGVEEIQDLVVKKLMTTSRKDIAMLYQGYRAVMADKRDKEKSIYKQINELIDARDKDQMNENANKDSKLICSKRSSCRNIFKRLLSE